MPRRTGEANTQVMLVLQGLPAKPGAALCLAPQSRPSLDAPWRDPGRAKATHAFAGPQPRRQEAR
jgi:hypothetical protein